MKTKHRPAHRSRSRSRSKPKNKKHSVSPSLITPNDIKKQRRRIRLRRVPVKELAPLMVMLMIIGLSVYIILNILGIVGKDKDNKGATSGPGGGDSTTNVPGTDVPGDTTVPPGDTTLPPVDDTTKPPGDDTTKPPETDEPTDNKPESESESKGLSCMWKYLFWFLGYVAGVAFISFAIPAIKPVWTDYRGLILIVFTILYSVLFALISVYVHKCAVTYFGICIASFILLLFVSSFYVYSLYKSFSWKNLNPLTWAKTARGGVRNFLATSRHVSFVIALGLLFATVYVTCTNAAGLVPSIIIGAAGVLFALLSMITSSASDAVKKLWEAIWYVVKKAAQSLLGLLGLLLTYMGWNAASGSGGDDKAGEGEEDDLGESEDEDEDENEESEKDARKQQSDLFKNKLKNILDGMRKKAETLAFGEPGQFELNQNDEQIFEQLVNINLDNVDLSAEEQNFWEVFKELHAQATKHHVWNDEPLDDNSMAEMESLMQITTPARLGVNTGVLQFDLDMATRHFLNGYVDHLELKADQMLLDRSQIPYIVAMAVYPLILASKTSAGKKSMQLTKMMSGSSKKKLMETLKYLGYDVVDMVMPIDQESVDAVQEEIDRMSFALSSLSSGETKKEIEKASGHSMITFEALGNEAAGGEASDALERFTDLARKHLRTIAEKGKEGIEVSKDFYRRGAELFQEVVPRTRDIGLTDITRLQNRAKALGEGLKGIGEALWNVRMDQNDLGEVHIPTPDVLETNVFARELETNGQINPHPSGKVQRRLKRSNKPTFRYDLKLIDPQNRSEGGPVYEIADEYTGEFNDKTSMNEPTNVQNYIDIGKRINVPHRRQRRVHPSSYSGRVDVRPNQLVDLTHMDDKARRFTYQNFIDKMKEVRNKRDPEELKEDEKELKKALTAAIVRDDLESAEMADKALTVLGKRLKRSKSQDYFADDMEVKHEKERRWKPWKQGESSSYLEKNKQELKKMKDFANRALHESTRVVKKKIEEVEHPNKQGREKKPNTSDRQGSELEEIPLH